MSAPLEYRFKQRHSTKRAIAGYCFTNFYMLFYKWHDIKFRLQWGMGEMKATDFGKK
jgi:hypothetical protein